MPENIGKKLHELKIERNELKTTQMLIISSFDENLSD
jgi:hypothetical protein